MGIELLLMKNRNDVPGYVVHPGSLDQPVIPEGTEVWSNERNQRSDLQITQHTQCPILTPRGVMTKVKIIVAVIAAVLTIIVIAQNTAVVETRILLTTISMPRAVLLMMTFGAGVVVGLLAAFSLSSRKKREKGKD